jgi:hypothetical protein
VPQHEDPRKRPLLNADQLRIIRRAFLKTTKGTPREEFEKLFDRTLTAKGIDSRKMLEHV